MSHLIAPSILSADFANIQRDCEMINNSKADWFHIDIMDGVFVPNISFGFPVLKAIQRHAKKPLDVHLMIIDPDRYAQAFKDAGAEVLTVHYEACTHLHRSIQNIKSLGMKAGVAINPHTAAHLLEDVIKDIDLICVMSVNPGFGGQKFIPMTLDKLREARKIIDASGRDIRLEVDGGVTPANIRQIAEAGADMFVAGSAIFGQPDYNTVIDEMRSELAKVGSVNL